MKFATAVKQGSHATEVMESLCTETEARLGGAKADAAFVFISSHFEDEARELLSRLARRHPTAAIVGCSAEGVLGGREELERTPAISLMLAELPGVEIRRIRAGAGELNSEERVKRFAGGLTPPPDQEPTFFLFGDPFSVPINPLLGAIDEAQPGRPVIGGMASGAERPGQAVLIDDDMVHRDGLVGLALSGPIEVRSVVSQGCRPIGDPFVITRAEKHIIHELGGKPALEQLKTVVASLSPEETELVQQALFVGRVINEYQAHFKRGDFLIRNLMGIDPDSGAIAVADVMRVGSTIQFHVRDRDSADEDLREMLAGAVGRRRPAGALMFTCNGRGTRMWPEPNHDVEVFQQMCGGEVPVAGFFAAGELGPVGSGNFIHGHTASIALFRKKAEGQRMKDERWGGACP